MSSEIDRIRHPADEDLCPCGTGYTYRACTSLDGPHAPDDLEYAYLVGKHYKDDMNQQVADRMLELEKLIDIETLVDDRWRGKK